jgi:hypothetical protein
MKVALAIITVLLCSSCTARVDESLLSNKIQDVLTACRQNGGVVQHIEATSTGSYNDPIIVTCLFKGEK